MNKTVTGTLAAAVVFILLGSLVIPNFAQTQGDLEDGLQSISTTSNWNDVVNTSASSNYTISGDNVTLTGNAGVLVTDVYSTSSSYDTLEVNVSNLAADTDVVLYNKAGTQLDSVTASGDTTVTLSEDNYNESGYYLNLSAATATDAVVDSYESNGLRSVDQDVQVLVYVTLLLFLVGLGLSFYARMQ